jgi:PA14 domain/Dolichyl-phosphate-mannose-protein mannosyltransferase
MSRAGARKPGADKAMPRRTRSPWLKGLGFPDEGESSVDQTVAAPEHRTSEGIESATARLLSPEDVKSSASLLRRSLARVWRARGIWLGLIGLACALYGQKLVTDGKEQAVVSSIHWYTAGIILVIIAWAGTYKNKSLLRLPDPSSVSDYPQPATGPKPVKDRMERSAILTTGWLRTFLRLSRSLRSGQAWRYILAFAALGLNLFAVSQLRADYYSAVGGWGWLASLVLLLVAFIGHRPRPGIDADAGVQDVEDHTDIHISRLLETVLVLGILALALGLRVYRLGDLTAGMHGDEGEFGLNAIRILDGVPVSPFKVGAFAFSNFTFWPLALAMKVFGINLFGLRVFSVLIGTLVLIPFYLLIRQWFGVRMTLIATFLLAVSDIGIFFSKLALNNVETAFSLVAGFYFLFRGLQTRRTINFVLSGLAFMFLSLYFYYAGRLTPVLVIAVVAYLFVLRPLLRLLGAYRELRRDTPGVGRARALRQATRTQTRVIFFYSGQLVIFAITCFCASSPFLVYELDHVQDATARVVEKSIFNQPARMTDRYKATHDPLYLGVRLPSADDLYPILPVTFEQTPLSVKLADDGFWPRVLWDQTTTTLSVFTLRPDASSFVPFSQEPISKPIEAALLVLGIAWALFRWRDTRMAILSIWFWSTILSGGVLTIDAPYVPRIVGIVPLLPIFEALVLNKLATEFVVLCRRIDWQQIMVRRIAQAFSGAAILALLGYLAYQNYNDYFNRYLAAYPFQVGTGQAYFVRQMNSQVIGEGRPSPEFFDLGAPFLYWDYSVNAFLNRDIDGHTVLDPSDELPIIGNGDRDVVFMAWNVNAHYLPILKEYYPDGEEATFRYGPNPDTNFLFTTYRVKREQIDARRTVDAEYVPASGSPVNRIETEFGSAGLPPDGLSYPVKVSWSGSLVAPAYGLYRFKLTGPADGQLIIDGVNVLNSSGSNESTGELALARGVHDVRLTGTLANPSTRASLQWAAGSKSEYSGIAREYLWNGPGRGLLAEIRPTTGDPFAYPSEDISTITDQEVVQRRVDGFIGFRDTNRALVNTTPFNGRWIGDLTIQNSGYYTFDVASNGASILLIDGGQVADNRGAQGNPAEAGGRVDLTAGTHHFELRYSWESGVGFLEAFWTPPGGERGMIPPDAFRTSGGAWPTGEIGGLPEIDLPKTGP